MADYYPLLARAVAGLATSTPDTRRAIYERARTALLGQLKKVEPPPADADIARESSALDEAIARLEAELGNPAKPEAAAPVAAAPAPPPAPAKPGLPPLPPAPKAPPVSRPVPPRPSFNFPASAGAPAGADTEAKPSETPVDAPALEANLVDAATEGGDLRLPRPRENLRPPAPAPADGGAGAKRAWIVGAVVTAVVVAVAALAFSLKEKPEDLARLKTAPPVIAPEQPANGKIAGRIGEQPGNAEASKPAASSSSAPPASDSAGQSIPIVNRAALLVEAPEAEGKVKTFIGSTLWRLDNVNTGPGQPLGTAVHANIEIPEAKVRVTLDMQKNMEKALSASHTIEVRFTLLPGSELPGVKAISTLQMRREETPTGESLSGIPVPITDTYFLIGLAPGDMESRNLDLIKTRGWLDLPIQLSNGRIAKLTIEKGSAGERVINDAISAWSQQK